MLMLCITRYRILDIADTKRMDLPTAIVAVAAAPATICVQRRRPYADPGRFTEVNNQM